MKNRRASGLIVPSVLFLLVLVILTMCQRATAAPVTISCVPSYDLYPQEGLNLGCVPTAIGMIMGHWDINGYSNLYSAQGNAVYLTTNVQNEISSPAHNAKYDPTPDNPSLPVPPKTSIADFVGTSVDIYAAYGILNGPGGTYPEKTAPGIVGYAACKGYSFQANFLPFSSSGETLIGEINAGRPMLFFIDADGDGRVEHSVPVFGYEDRGIDGLWYEFYPNYNGGEAPAWAKYQEYIPDYVQNSIHPIDGVYRYIKIIPGPIPEPTTIVLLTLALPLVLRRRKNAPPRQ